DTATGRLTDSWRLPRGYSVCNFSPDGRLALLNDGKVFRLWDLTARKELRQLQGKGESGRVEARFSPDGRFVVTHSDDFRVSEGLVRAWNVATGQELWHESIITGLWDRGLALIGFLPDGKALVVRDKANGRVGLRDCATGRERRSFATMPSKDARMQGLSPDGKTLFIGTAGTAVRAWDVAGGKELPPLGGHKTQAHSFAVSRDSKIVLTGGGNPFVLVWDWPSGKLRRKIDLDTRSGALPIAVSADGKRAEIIVGAERTVRSFDLATGKELPGPAEAHRGAICGLAIAPDGRAVTVAQDDTVRVWDPRSGRQLHEYPTGRPVGGPQLALSADGRLVATSDYNYGTVWLQDRDTGRLVRTIDTGGQGATTIAFAPEGRLLAACGHREGLGAGQHFLGLWDADTGREVRRLEMRGGAPALSPDGRLVAALAFKDQVRLWEVATGKPYFAFTSPDAASRLAFSPDGKTLACAGRIALWEVASGKLRLGMEKLPDGTECLAFSPVGKLLASGGRDGKVRLWDLATGKQIRILAGHRGGVSAVAFSPDGRALVSASWDTTGLVWDVADLAARPPPRERLSPHDLSSLWTDLAGADAPRAYRAVWSLAAAPEQIVPLLEERLAPAAPADPRRLGRLVADLDSDEFAVREKAGDELERLGGLAGPALRQALHGQPSLEVR
ncbi:MAG TPA: WD40 repeat domain-containing protein, partial [Gemmataceae bacterium]|nr:WD40 repeat domain-containing protein [Gemmataceae bacterium]